MANTRSRGGRGRRGPARLKLVRPRPVDAHVGARMRLRRTMLGMSQEKLGEALGLTFQQVQKYERGTNRVGASRLWELTKILDVPIGYFYDDMPDEIAATVGKHHISVSDIDLPNFEADTLARRETLELVRAYYKIKNPRVRKKVFDLAKALAKAESVDD
jgi:transcriptional regulator with XRE-family HTH domain